MSVWTAIVESRDFWRSSLSLAHRTHGPEAQQNLHTRLELAFGVGALHLSFAFSSFGKGSLELFDDLDGHRLGELDTDSMNDVLRWDEFEIIARFFARSPGPSWAVDLLLLPYTAVSPDVAELYVARTRDALAASRFFGVAEIEAIAGSARERVREDLRWILDPSLRGWVAEGTHVHSLRRREGAFPFDLWNRFVTAVEKKLDFGGEPD